MSCRINNLPDDILLIIFDFGDLLARRRIACVCQRWQQLSNKLWAKTSTVVFYTLFPNHCMPYGKQLNKALHWVLRRCGANLVCLNLADLNPYPRFSKINRGTFEIIGHYCPQLEVINFGCQLVTNEYLHYFCELVNCSKIRVANFSHSFSHQTVVNTGLSAFYDACRQIEVLNISHSTNARIRDVQELWPTTLIDVYIDDALAITGYTLLSLSKCCPDLEVFSMCGNGNGMSEGLRFVLTRLKQIRKLYIRNFPGDTELGIQIGCLQTLHELYLGASSFVNDEVLCAVAYSCPELVLLECNLEPFQDEARYSKYGKLTDKGLETLGKLLPKLKSLELNYRHHVTDAGLIAVGENGYLQKLSIAGCQGITFASLQVFAALCSQLQFINISHLSQISTSDLIHFMSMWFQSSEVSSGELIAEDIYIDFSQLREHLEPVCSVPNFEFTQLGKNGFRRIIKVYNDMIFPGLDYNF